MSTKFTALRRRSRRWVPATIFAFIMLALGSWLTAGAIMRWIDGQWPVFTRPVIDAASAATWEGDLTRAVVIGIGVVGVIVLVIAILPGAPRLSSLRRPGAVAADARLVVSRRGLARLAAAAAHRVDGVQQVAASVSGRSVSIRVVTPTRQDTSELRQRVKDAVSARLTEVGVEPAARVRVSATVKEI
ncbi:DUF6286 domain-containing protein [Bogoriella caseilytica]|uniref:DUF6286 domain-containing protein n=1 Tax=Bogoriella caseilytica TaxID=56055 RepID=A0A3N2BEM8_9MICO|nr:DUF6286 domain-containing protein [Bogoriella caseilytica]ROR73494.1 hypothetical protein EDD31_1876 [Bogoriella caseilytica]